MPGLGIGMGIAARKPQAAFPFGATGLRAWGDARQGVLLLDSDGNPVTNGGQVALIQNRIDPGTYDIAQPIGASQWIYDATKKRVISDGADDFMVMPIPISGNDWCIVLVGRRTNTLENHGIVSLYTPGDDTDFESLTGMVVFGTDADVRDNGIITLYRLFQPQQRLLFLGDQSAGFGVNMTLICNSTPSGFSLHVNDLVETAAALNSGFESEELYIGARPDDAPPFNFSGLELSQILVFEGGRTPEQIAQLQAWAAKLTKFTPAHQAGLLLWLDSRYGLLNADGHLVGHNEQVARWVNRANPGTYDAVQATGSRQPIRDSSTHELVFDGVSDALVSDVPIVGVDWSIVVVFRMDEDALDSRIISAMNDTDTEDFNTNTSVAALIYNLSLDQFVNANGGYGYCQVDAPPAGEKVFAISQFNALEHQLYINDDSQINADAPPLTINAHNFYIGAARLFGVLASFAKCRIKGIVVYDSPRTPEQIAELKEWATSL